MQPAPTNDYGPGLRHAAGALRARAERATTVVNQLDGMLASMIYAGPAADRFRVAVVDVRDRLRQVRSILLEAAEACLRTADSLDAEARTFRSMP